MRSVRYSCHTVLDWNVLYSLSAQQTIFIFAILDGAQPESAYHRKLGATSSGVFVFVSSPLILLAPVSDGYVADIANVTSTRTW